MSTDAALPGPSVWLVALAGRAILLAVLVRFVVLLAVFGEPMTASMPTGLVRLGGGVRIGSLIASMLDALAIAFSGAIPILALGVRLAAGLVVL